MKLGLKKAEHYVRLFRDVLKQLCPCWTLFHQSS